MKKKITIIICSILISVIGIYSLINYTFFSPTKLNSFIAAKIYNEPANTSFINTDFYKCIIDSYNVDNDSDLAYTDSITESQLKTIKSLSCSSKELSKEDITNIDKLINLESLDLSNNNINEIDLSLYPKLKTLNLSNNNISSIDISNNLIITTLDLSNNNISEINLLQHMDIKTINLSKNNLTQIDLSSNTKLVELILGMDENETNNIKTLNLENQKYLDILYANYLGLESLKFPSANNTHYLAISNNAFTHMNNISFGNFFNSKNTNSKKTLILSHNSELEGFIQTTSMIDYLDVSYTKLHSIGAYAEDYLNVSHNENLTEIEGGSSNIYLTNANNLEIIRLNGNYETFDISNCNNLEELSLSNSSFESFTFPTSAQLKVLSFSKITFPTDYHLDLSKYENLEKLKLSEIDSNGMLELSLTKANIVELRDMDFSKFTVNNWANLSGTNTLNILLSSNLENLNLSNIEIDSVAIKEIENLKSIDLSNSSIREFHSNDSINLENLNFENSNLLEKIMVTETNYVGKTSIKSINVNKCSKLYQLELPKTEFEDIDLSTNTELETLRLRSSVFNNINLDNNTKLEWLFLTNNKNLTEINLLNNINLTSLNISNTSISSLNNVPFDNLTGLYISDTLIEEIDLSNNKVRNFYAQNSKLQKILFNNPIACINAASRKFEVIDVSGSSNLNEFQGQCFDVQELNISNTKLKTLNLENKKILEDLNMDATLIENIDLSKLVNLKKLNANNTNLSTLNLTNNVVLENLFANNNDNLEEVKFGEIYEYLEVVELSNSKISIFDLGGANNLSTLALNNTNISNLDISNFVNLEILNISNTNISDIDFTSNEKIEQLYMNNTNVEDLNLRSSGYVTNMDISNTKLKNVEISIDNPDSNAEVILNNNEDLENLEITSKLLHIRKLDLNNSSKIKKLKLINIYSTEKKDLEISSENIEELEIVGRAFSSSSIVNTINKQLNLKKLNLSTDINSLDLSNNKELTELILDMYNLQELEINIKKNSKLEIVRLKGDIKGVNFDNNPNLKEIEIMYNKSPIENLDLSNNNLLTSVDLKNSYIKKVYVSDGFDRNIITNYDGEIVNVNSELLYFVKDNHDLLYNKTEKIEYYKEANIIQKLVWSSSNDKVITVDQEGNITAIGEGTATITVKTEDEKFTDTCIVNVLMPKIKTMNLDIISEKNNKLYKGYAGNISIDITTENIIDNESIMLTIYKDKELVKNINASDTKVLNNSAKITLDIPNNLDVGKYVVKLGYEDIVLEEFDFEVFDLKDVTGINANDIILSSDGTEIKIDYKIIPNDAYDTRVEFEIEDENVAQIIEDKIKGLKQGNTRLTITSISNPECSKTVNVSVVDKSIEISDLILESNILNNIDKIYETIGGKLKFRVETFNLDIDKVNIDIINSDGNSIYDSENLKPQGTINEKNYADIEVNIPENLSAGTYTLEISSNNIKTTENFVIEEYIPAKDIVVRYNGIDIKEIVILENDEILLDYFLECIDANTCPTFNKLNYSIADESIAGVTNNQQIDGIVVGLKKGTTELIINVGFQEFRIPVKVIEIPEVKYGALNIYSNVPGNKTMDNYYGGKYTIEANFDDINANKDVTLKNISLKGSDSNQFGTFEFKTNEIKDKKTLLEVTFTKYQSIPGLNSGIFNANGGTYVVNYFYYINDTKEKKLEDSFEIELKDYVELNKINISKTNIKLDANETFDLNSLTSYEPSNATNKNVEYDISNNNILKITGSTITGVSEGTTTVTITSKDNANAKATITVTVEKNDYVEFDNKLNIHNENNSKYLKGILENSTYKELKSNIDTNLSIVLKTSDGKKISSTSTILKTGMKLSVGDTTYDIVIKGDISGDGKMSITDLSQMRYHLAQVSGKVKTGPYKIAGDMNDKDGVTITDLSQMRKKLAGVN